MTRKQLRFIDEYLVDLNATQAAIRAGYSPKTANQTASENLAKPDIRAEIDARLEAIRSEKIADTAEVMEYLTAVLRGESFASVLALCGDGCQTVIEKRPDEKERLKAAELLGKRYGIFTDRLGIDGVIPVVISGDEQLED